MCKTMTLPSGIPRENFKERVGGVGVQWVGRLGAIGAMVCSKFIKKYIYPP